MNCGTVPMKNEDTNLFSRSVKRVTRQQKQIGFLSTSSVFYLYSSVKPLLVLRKVFMTCKSIRVAQLANKLAFLVFGAKIVRQTTDVFQALYLTRGFRIHCCFLKYLIEPFSKQSFCESNAFKGLFSDACNGLNNRAQEHKQAETHIRCFKRTEKREETAMNCY